MSKEWRERMFFVAILAGVLGIDIKGLVCVESDLQGAQSAYDCARLLDRVPLDADPFNVEPTQ